MVMNAAKLDIDWQQADLQDELAPVKIVTVSEGGLKHRAYTRQVSPPRAAANCPHCESIIYSRRNKLCGVCGEVLPAGLLFSPSEARRIERLLQSEKLKHKGWMHRIVTGT
jgi:hypothetical protein